MWKVCGTWALLLPTPSQTGGSVQDGGLDEGLDMLIWRGEVVNECACFKILVTHYGRKCNLVPLFFNTITVLYFLTSSRLPPAWLDRECVRGRRGGNKERLVLTWRRARLQSLGNRKAQRLWKSNPQPTESERWRNIKLTVTFFTERVHLQHWKTLIAHRCQRMRCLTHTERWIMTELRYIPPYRHILIPGEPDPTASLHSGDRNGDSGTIAPPGNADGSSSQSLRLILNQIIIRETHYMTTWLHHWEKSNVVAGIRTCTHSIFDSITANAIYTQSTYIW